MNFAGAAERLSDIDLPRLGADIGVGEDEIHAILDVECRGRGFDGKGRPAMLFEPHIFHRELKRAGLEAELKQAVAQGLAYPKWRRNYPKDSYPRLLAAMRIHREIAFRSASWGLGQIMGFNCSMCGYASAEAMVAAFMKGEDVQLEAMIRFIVSAGIDDELRRHDWRGFARIYNGPSYEKHGYHTRLAAAFDKWSKIPDTEWKRKQATRTTLAPGGDVIEGEYTEIVAELPAEPVAVPQVTKPEPQGFWAKFWAELARIMKPQT